MRKLLIAATASVFLAGASAGLVDAKVPNLVGTWTVKAEGGVLVRGDKTGKTAHWEKGQVTLEAEAVITEQKGRVIYGTFASKKNKENFIAVIRDDGHFFFADEDGFLEGKLIDKDTIETVYRHVTATETVISLGVWTRKK
jgi:hypothetical protein